MKLNAKKLINVNKRDEQKFVRFQKTMFYVLTTPYRRNIKSKKLFIYHEKIIKKHLNFVQNAKTIFRMITKKIFTKKSKIVFFMQFLIEKFKKS